MVVGYVLSFLWDSPNESLRPSLDHWNRILWLLRHADEWQRSTIQYSRHYSDYLLIFEFYIKIFPCVSTLLTKNVTLQSNWVRDTNEQEKRDGTSRPRGSSTRSGSLPVTGPSFPSPHHRNLQLWFCHRFRSESSFVFHLFRSKSGFGFVMEFRFVLLAGMEWVMFYLNFFATSEGGEDLYIWIVRQLKLLAIVRWNLLKLPLII